MIAPSPSRLSEPKRSEIVRSTVLVLQRHCRKAVLFFLGVMTFVAGWLLFGPRTYESEARLMVRVGRESVTLDPTATTGQTISVHDSREMEINSVLDVLSSRVILERVVDELGPQTILGGSAGPGGKQLRERAIEQLERTIDTWHGRKSSVISLRARAGSPELAQRILQAFVRAFHTTHLEANRTSGSYAFFVKQADIVQQQLLQADGNLSRAKNEIDLISVEEQRQTIQDQMSQTQSQRVLAETSLATTEATIVQLQAAFEALPERLVTQTVAGFPDGAAGQTRRHMYELEIREKELLTKYTEHHPLVQAVREQIDQAGDILDTPEAPIEQTTMAINPARQQIELQLVNERAQAVALRAQVEALAGQQALIARRLHDLNDREGNIARLEQRVALLNDAHQSYAEKREQARIDQALADERITNVNVVQPPTYVSRPAAPSKRLVAALGLIVAVLGAIGLAFGCEYVRRLAPTELAERDVHRNGNGRISSLVAESHTHDAREASELAKHGVR